MTGARSKRLCCFPPLDDRIAYTRLLYEDFAERGIEVVPDPCPAAGWLSLRWSWRSRDAVDILHLHWPQGLWHHDHSSRPLRAALSWVKLATLAVRLPAARLLGYRIAWTIHQVHPHDSASRRLDRLGARLLARACDVLLAHDADTAAAVRAELGRAARGVHIVPHGSFIGVYPPGRSRAEMRTALSIPQDAFVFLAFGLIRAYKDMGLLLEGFTRAGLDNARLVVAGPVHDEAEADRLRAAAARDERIVPLLGFVADERVAELFGACDAAVLARAGGTSGSLLLALSLGLPIVAARTSAYAELTAGERAAWLFEPGDRGSLQAALERAAADPALAGKSQAAREQMSGLSWGETRAQTTAHLLGAPT